ncbi:Glutamine--fructose-6-phosphate aminotransferase [isomerizing] [Poriferisphaera corsica]|uniref:Glutamine--fructose-6-phosphate aminotransferase [isomerizing] n=1 Tax=Poriferisphaera corsica TaxID=2528020 RepID=A0A517YTA4_9BACT|nr:glutamine--fructose-6-phosphate transaminase (isomerizing) [Poriferisphaera corsica]QDU33456.1 Glutamine--fructose-6-phosphate aminotransferase [isomerizing] [Poriferisphaera corsica]
MCGIVAYVGNRAVTPLLIEGLKRLEYRGYDSAGIAVRGNSGELSVTRAVGRVSNLELLVEEDAQYDEGFIGIAHTRWATHGEPSVDNAHPHVGLTKDGHTVAVVHNGIIENYSSLRTYLEGKGHTFYSQTDTEVLAKLIAELYVDDLETAVQKALQEVSGAYAIAVMIDGWPHTLVCARKGSPLIVGVADHAYVVASDASAIVSHTTQVFALEDYQVVKLSAGPVDEKNGTGEPWSSELRTTTIDNVVVDPEITELEMDLEQIELGGYSHYMLKEIMEQPEAVRDCLRGRVDLRDSKIILGGIQDFKRQMVRAKRFILTGQGTAYHAGLIGEYLFEDLARVPARCEYASEFRYRNPIIEDDTIVVAVSQSGETADTLAALAEAKDRGALSIGVVNAVGSTISRETDAGVYLRVGPEIGVASTKAFVGQVMVLTLLSLYLGKRKHMSNERVDHYLKQLSQIPDQIEKVLKQTDHIKNCVKQVADRDNWLFLGRGYNYPVAIEGALKLKEISYIHAEGMPAAEMKHGPIALIDEGMPVVFVATQGTQYEKVISNIEEVRARGGKIIAVATEGDTHIHKYASEDCIFYVPDVMEALQPLLTSVPLQLLAYHAAVERGHDVDKPRNLAKSVTVE